MGASLKVIHSCTSRSFSGLERYVIELASWQNKQCKNVELFCQEETEVEEKARSRGIPVWTIKHNSRPGPLLWATMIRDWHLRLKQGPLTLHMHAGWEPWFHLPWLLKRSRALAKTILHYHIWINHKKKDLLHQVVFRGVDEVWASTESARAHLATLLPVSRQNIRAIPYGRDVQQLSQIPKEKKQKRMELGIPEDACVGICISRIEPIKGTAELFEAFLKVAHQCPKLHLLLVGDASPGYDSTKAFTASLKKRWNALEPSVRNRFHFLGFVSDCLPLMAASDFYVLPTYEECMSLAMLDALILGLPVLGTNSGGTPSVVRPEETGILVPPRDVDALAQGLKTFYDDPERRSKLSGGAQVLGSSFHQEKIFSDIWEYYVSQPPAISV